MSDQENLERLEEMRIRGRSPADYIVTGRDSDALEWAVRTIRELQATEEERWDDHAVRCGNCDVEIRTRKGSAPNNNGLSKAEGEDEALCGLCAGEEMYRLMGENDKAEARIAELEAEGRVEAGGEMSCEPIKMVDGTVVLANVKPGEVLTESDKEIIAQWVQFCRDRKAKRDAKEQRERNRRAK